METEREREQRGEKKENWRKGIKRGETGNKKDRPLPDNGREIIISTIGFEPMT